MSTDVKAEPTELVTVAHHGGVALLTLNLAKRRNVLSKPLVRAVRKRFDEIEQDESVRCVVITGDGSAFCAGAELSTLRASADGDFASVREVYDGFLRVLGSPLPTIAAVNGPAVGAGFNLALACDIRIAAMSAVFDTRFSALRLHPGGGHAWLLSRIVGQQQATMACLFGEVWNADRAKAVGLVAEVCSDETLVETAIALGRRLDTQEGPFVRTLTETLRKALVTPSHEEALAYETEAQEKSTTSAAFRAGVAAIEAQVAKTRKK